MKKAITVFGVFVIALVLGYVLGQSPAAKAAAAGPNVVVLCSGCLPPGGNLNNAQDRANSGVILLDVNTGGVWIYHDRALQGTTGPLYVGKLTQVGKPLQK